MNVSAIHVAPLPECYYMYEKPTVRRFGSFRELTQAGCTGASDGQTFYGTTGPSVGSTPRVTDGTTDFCFHGGGSR